MHKSPSDAARSRLAGGAGPGRGTLGGGPQAPARGRATGGGVKGMLLGRTA